MFNKFMFDLSLEFLEDRGWKSIDKSMDK